MSIILPGSNDPMFQRAAQAERQQQETFAVINSMKGQMFICIYTQLAMAHSASDEELSLDSGRELAKAASDIAENIVGNYSSFMFEKMGILKLEKVDNPTIVE